jgi:hypothetical protein
VLAPTPRRRLATVRGCCQRGGVGGDARPEARLTAQRSDRSWPRAVSMVLVSLALLLLISGCSGASPETRAKQTRTARLSTRTPTPRVQETVVRIDQEQAGMLTAEAFLPIAAPLPSTAPTRRSGPAATPAGQR